MDAHKNIYYTKEKSNLNYLFLLKLGCIIVAAIIMSGFFKSEALASSSMVYYDYASKKDITYTGKQVKVNYNGRKISKDENPGIIVNGIALLSYKDIFANSSIDASCVYNKEAGTVTISNGDTTIVLTINSKTAMVNDKKVNMSVAPIKIKYRTNNVAKILVPSRFVAENLGYKYTWYSGTSTVEIEGSSLWLSYNGGSKFAYTGSTAQTSIDGRVVGHGNMPNIIVNNTTMVRAKRVFADTEIGATYSYNKKDKTVTLSTKDTSLVMTIGSTTAYLNGNPIEMSIAPMIVTNHEAKTNYVMVPGSFTASCLGYDYKWNQEDRMSELTSRPLNPSSGNKNNDSNSNDNSNHVNKPDTKEDNKTPVEPELGDNSIAWEKGKILHQWLSNEVFIGKGSKKQSISGTSPGNTDDGTILSIVETSYTQMLNGETFQFYGSKAYGKVTSELKKNTITIQIHGMNSYVQNFYPLSLANSVVQNITARYDINTSITTIEVKLRQEDVSYDLALSPDKMSLYLNIYRNSITSASVGTNELGDYLTLTAMGPMRPKISVQNGYIMLDFPYTANGIEDQYTMVDGAKYISQIYIADLMDRTQVYLGLKSEVDYYIIENGGWYTVSLQAKNSNYKPPTPVEEAPVVEWNNKNVEIIIPKPDGIEIEMITDKDLYLKKQFVIILPGDYRTYFQTNPISANSNVIKKVDVSLNNNYETEIWVTTSKIQGYEYTTDDSFIYINVDNPKNIYKNIVVLDPGHGGGANGAQYFNTKEKDINFKILYTLGEKYFNAPNSKIKAYYTRTADNDVGLYDRAAFAKEVGADLFVSLHMNASTSKTVKGMEVYYSTNNNSKNRGGLNSETLASRLLNDLLPIIGTDNRGIKKARFVVVHHNTVPAVLVELGFMSNSSDYNKITNGNNQEKVAKQLYDSLCNIFDRYPTGR